MARGNDCCQQAFGGRLVPNNNAGNDDAGGHADGNAGGHADGNAEERSNAGDGKDDGRQGWQCPRKSRRESRLPTNPPPPGRGFSLKFGSRVGVRGLRGLVGGELGTARSRNGSDSRDPEAPPRLAEAGGSFLLFFFEILRRFGGFGLQT